MVDLFDDVELDVGAFGDVVGHGEVAAAVGVSLESGILLIVGTVKRVREECSREVGAVQVAQCGVTALGLVVVVAIETAPVLAVVVLTSCRGGCVGIYKAALGQFLL